MSVKPLDILDRPLLGVIMIGLHREYFRSFVPGRDWTEFGDACWSAFRLYWALLVDIGLVCGAR